jgi:YVTN family beta-propeller protein
MRQALAMVGIALAACAGAERTRPPSGPPPLVVVSNEGSGDLAVLDASTDEVVSRIHVGMRPRGLRVSPDGRTVYAALSGSPRSPPGVSRASLPRPDRAGDGIAVVDLAAAALRGVLPGGQDPEAFDLLFDGRTLVVSNEETAEASFVDVVEGRVVAAVPVGEEPEGVTVSPDGRLVAVVSERAHRVDFLDAETRRIVARVPTDLRPRSIVFTPDRRMAFVPCEEGGSVTVIDARALERISEIRLGGGLHRPVGAAVSPDGRRVFVTAGKSGAVAAIDVDALEVSAWARDVGARPWGIAVTPDGRKLYVANGPSGDVAVLDARSLQVLRRVAVGDLPWGVAMAAR